MDAHGTLMVDTEALARGVGDAVERLAKAAQVNILAALQVEIVQHREYGREEILAIIQMARQAAQDVLRRSGA